MMITANTELVLPTKFVPRTLSCVNAATTTAATTQRKREICSTPWKTPASAKSRER